jgi:hypothetical protein
MKRPLSVTILLWLVLSLTVWSGLRLYSAIQWWGTLFEFASSPGPWYITISGGIWLIVSILLLWGMWQAKAWIRFALLGAGAGFSVWYWSDRLLFQMSSANWLFVLLGNILLLIVLTVCVFVPSTNTFLSKREAHDR